MKIYRRLNNGVLHGFQDPIGEVPVLGKRLSSVQVEIVTSRAGQVIDVDSAVEIKDDSYLIFSENLFFTASFFDQVMKAIKVVETGLVFCVEENDFNKRFVLPFNKDKSSSLCFEMEYIVKGKDKERFFIKQSLYDFDVRLPDQIVKGGSFPMPQCDCFAAPIISPFHLLQVNMALNLNRSLVLQKSKFIARFKNLKGRLGAFLFYRGLKKLNKVGKNSFIHPSAIIDGSIIGENVRIGAGAIVRLSYIGDDCTISDNVVVANSVLGNKTFISNSNFIELCMTFEEAFLIHGPYQFSIFGRKSACFATINCDIRLDQNNIVIPTSVGYLDSNQALLGIAYGHGSKTGGGNIIAAGRIVPNNLHINPPDSIILKFEE